MKESVVWNYLKKGMISSGWHVTRIESSVSPGFPDVSYGLPGVNGFLELKFLPSWPKRTTTNVKLPLRPEQKWWIKARGQLSGNVWVFIRIEDDFFLLGWEAAMLAYDGWTKEFWIEEPLAYHWHKKINFEELTEILKGGC